MIMQCLKNIWPPFLFQHGSLFFNHIVTNFNDIQKKAGKNRNLTTLVTLNNNYNNNYNNKVVLWKLKKKKKVKLTKLS